MWDLSFSDTRFVKSVFRLNDLPEPAMPELAFAGRSNVGKSSLINCLIKRKKLVKTSSKPGKTQSLNFFSVADTLYLVDLPGYGYANVPKKIKQEWQSLITTYLETRDTLRGVVLIIDLRHGVKSQDMELVNWLRMKSIFILPVYTKSDKLSKNERRKNAAILDAGFNVRASERVVFSAKTGDGRSELLDILDRRLF